MPTNIEIVKAVHLHVHCGWQQNRLI